MSSHDPRDSQDPHEIQPQEAEIVDIGTVGSTGGTLEPVRDEYDDESLASFESPDPIRQLCDTLVTEDGECMADVFVRMCNELHQTNKILYKLLSVVERK